MLVSINELKKYVDISAISTKDIANKLTFAGLEVEEITSLASASNLVIAKIISCKPLEESDHLHILNVDEGEKYGIQQIVCGAPNAREGIKVIVARPGAKLPGIEIKEGIIRGVKSNGMCCSLKELGVETKYIDGPSVDGIEELDEDALIGNEDVLGYLGLDDEILNINILPNRSDCMSLYNVAREVASLFSLKVKEIELSSNKLEKAQFSVSSKTEKCLQFASKEIDGIEVKESPLWLKRALRSLGQRSINNIVDIGNYVMLVFGQPLHMYDKDKLPSNELIAIDDYEGDFVALDEKTYAVQKGDIVISSMGKPMCLAGVMGSLASEVTSSSKNIIIESASFNQTSIRKTSIRLNLISESSQRFVRGTNSNQSDFILNYTASLIRSVCGLKKEYEIYNYDVIDHKMTIINTSVSYINHRLGTSFTSFEVISALQRVYMEVKTTDNEHLEVSVPFYRIDIKEACDLSEEVVRLLGFENVPSSLPLEVETMGEMSLSKQKEFVVRNYLLGQGIDEVLSYSLLTKDEVNEYAYLNKDEAIKLLHPLTDKHEVMRNNILPSLLQIATYNVARQMKDFRLFEVSDVYTSKGEEKHLAIVLLGDNKYRHALKTIPFDFYSIKGYLEGILSLFGIDQNRYKLERLDSLKDEFHPGKSASLIVMKKTIGVLGEIHPSALKKYDLGKNSVCLLELNLTELFNIKTSPIKMSPITRFPLVSRDLALLLKSDITSKDVIKVIKQCGSSLVKNVEVFDVYEGKGMKDGYLSLAVRVYYGSDEKTLKEEEITEAERLVKHSLSATLNAELRMS